MLQIHTPDTDAPYVVRGPTYLKDKKKVPAGLSQFAFAAMDVIQACGGVRALGYWLALRGQELWGSERAARANTGDMLMLL